MPVPSSFLFVLIYYGFYLENGPESSGIIKKAENSFPAFARFLVLTEGLGLREPGCRLLRAEASPDSFIQELYLMMASFSGVSVCHVWK